MDNILALLALLLVGLVAASPSVKLSIPEGAEVQKGDDVRIICTATDFKTGAILKINKWNNTASKEETLMTNGQLDNDVPDKDRYSARHNNTGIGDYDFTLQIQDVQFRDGGTFICSIRFEDESSTSRITMKVYAPPATTPSGENIAPSNNAASLIVVMAMAVSTFL